MAEVGYDGCFVDNTTAPDDCYCRYCKAALPEFLQQNRDVDWVRRLTAGLKIDQLALDSPEWAEAETGIPAATLDRIAAGNLLDRGPEEYYVSAPHRLPGPARLTGIRWEAVTPSRTWVKAQLRCAASAETRGHTSRKR